MDASAFRATMGSFTTGVGVMTTVVDGAPHGMTVNAVSSVSLDPLLVLVCVERRTVMSSRVSAAGVFALSFLRRSQAPLSTLFADASRGHGDPQFVGVERRVEATGSPILVDNLGWLDCRVWSIADGGDHLIVLGEVVAVGADLAEHEPLVYHRGAYGTFTADAT